MKLQVTLVVVLGQIKMKKKVRDTHQSSIHH